MACKLSIELEQKAALCYLLILCSSEFVEILLGYSPPLATLGPFTSISKPTRLSSNTIEMVEKTIVRIGKIKDVLDRFDYGCSG